MKTCQKALAIVLSLCMVLSTLVFSVSAEGDPAVPVSFNVNSAKVAQYKTDDPETVMQLEIELSVKNGSDGKPLAVFDQIDRNAEIVIYESIYFALYSTLIRFVPVDEKAVRENATIATAKPVSYADGKLILDVFGKDGSAGAKMVSIIFESLQGNSNLIFLYPEGVLSDSSSGMVSTELLKSMPVEGLQIKTIQLPSLAHKIFKYVEDNNYIALIGLSMVLLPFATIIIPILLNQIAKKSQKVYDIYGIDVYQTVKDIRKALFKIIPVLLQSRNTI